MTKLTADRRSAAKRYSRTCTSTRSRSGKPRCPAAKRSATCPGTCRASSSMRPGMLPVGIFGGGDQLEVIQGDAYYQSYICRIPRSTIELGLTGRLDCLDGMLFPSICDVIRNLSGMWQIMFKDKYVRYFDVPQEYQRRGGRRILRARDAVAARRPRQACRAAGLRRRLAQVDRRVQRELPRDARAVRLPVRQTVAGTDLRGVPRLARGQRAAARGTHAARARLHRRGGRRTASEARQRPRGRHRLVLRAAAARSHQVDRDGRLLHRRRRPDPRQLAGCSTTSRPRAIRSSRCRRLSCTAPRRPRRSTTHARRTRASSSSIR